MKVETVVFLSLVLDLFAFTIPLPLFPRLIEWYTLREASDRDGFLNKTLESVSAIRAYFYNPPTSSSVASNRKWDIVLLGGLMGSVFSTLQFLVSPSIGSLSDRHGRKKVLLWTMFGNILSAVIWLVSTRFSWYLLSRVVGGLSEGNVQLAIAILSDITTPATRSRTLAQVGIAFAICFCIGPPIGAYFASRPLPLPALLNPYNLELNIYAAPAMITLLLVSAETVFLYAFLPETKGFKVPVDEVPKPQAKASTSAKTIKVKTVSERVHLLGNLRLLHFLFLGVFSGVEFTLTFLTFDLFDWSNAQNGSLIGSIGIISALLQGGYVRRSISKVGEGRMARRGIFVCSIGFAFLSLLSKSASNGTEAGQETAKKLLWASAVCFAFTSSTVVNSLTAAASLLCDEDTAITSESLAKGKALGKFRSSGQLGRALGPIIACASYWTFGPTLTYGTAATSMALLTIPVGSMLDI